MDDFARQLAVALDVPPELAEAWRREGLMRDLHRSLWRLKIRRMMDEVAADLTAALRADSDFDVVVAWR